MTVASMGPRSLIAEMLHRRDHAAAVHPASMGPRSLIAEMPGFFEREVVESTGFNGAAIADRGNT